jgi:transcriptional regulator with XRE-family HTH domain
MKLDEGQSAKSAPADDIEIRVAARLREARLARGLTLEQLAETSGVSRAMISRIELGHSSPTAGLLGRLCGGLGLAVSDLFREVETAPSPLARASEQPVWIDPATGYRRRSMTPPGSRIDIVHVSLPAGARVDYPATAYAAGERQIVVLKGELEFGNGDAVFRLQRGDCLRIPQRAASWYANPGAHNVEYLVVYDGAA